MSPEDAKAWEIERDRFGVMVSGPLEVGEAIKVVPAERAERAEAAARAFAEALSEIVERCPSASKHDIPGLIARSALAAHPSYTSSNQGERAVE